MSGSISLFIRQHVLANLINTAALKFLQALTLVHLHQTHKALQLPLFFFFFSLFLSFFCQPYPGLRNCESVFLILKVSQSQYDGSRRWVQCFQGIHVRIDIKINIFISIRNMITKFGKQVLVKNLARMTYLHYQSAYAQ